MQQEGFGPYQLTIHDGQRWSAASGLSDSRCCRGQNLTIEAMRMSRRVLFERQRAVGVEFVQKKQTRARRAPAARCCCAAAR